MYIAKYTCTNLNGTSSTIDCLFFRLQAQLLNAQSELLEVKAAKVVTEKSLDEMLLQLHKCQLELQEKIGGHGDSESIKKKLVRLTIKAYSNF